MKMNSLMILLCCVVLVVTESTSATSIVTTNSPRTTPQIDKIKMPSGTINKQLLQEYLQQFLPEGLSRTLKEMLDDSGTGFSPATEAILAMIETQICPVESKVCDPMGTENWLFGCNCRIAITKLGYHCKRLPCRAFRRLRADGPPVLRRLLALDGPERLVAGTDILVEYLVKPLFEALCECPKVVDASLTCVQKYNGKFFEKTNRNRTEFDEFVRSMDWKSLKKVMNVWLIESWCGNIDGRNCIEDLGNNFRLSAEFLENTFAERDVCISLVRSANEINRYLDANLNKGSLNDMVDAFWDVEKIVTCDPGCAPEIAEKYYTCCAKRSLEVSRTKSMKRALVKVAKSFYGKTPKLGSIIDKYLSIYDVEEFCRGQTDVYGKKNDVCEAIEA